MNWFWGSETAAFTGNRILQAAKGTYRLIGLDAALLLPRTLTAATGTYTLTGNASNFTKGQHLIAERGEYVLTGGASTGRRVVITPEDPAPFVENAWVPAQRIDLAVDWTRDEG